MTGGKGRSALLVGALALMVALASLPNAEAAETTLVARLPISLDGTITTAAQDGALHLAPDATGRTPRLVDLLFTAGEARISITNFSDAETPLGESPVGNPLDQSAGGSNDITPDSLRDVRFDIKSLRPDFALFVYDGAKAGASYAAFPTEAPAHLDVELIEKTLSYAAEPEGLDFTLPVNTSTFRFDADAMRYDVRGDFTFVLHGATLITDTPERIYTHKTGTWTEENGDTPAGTAYTVRTTQYAIVEVTNGIMTMNAAGGSQDLYAEAGDLVVDVDGGITADGAAGSLQIGDDVIRPKGDRVRAEGHFTLTPDYVIEGGSKQVVFTMDGQIESLSVGAARYTTGETVAAVAAATGLTALLIGFGAYFWPTAKAAVAVPLYAKLTKDKILDQSTRSLIHAKVEQDPGCQVKQIADALEVSWTTAAYHLRVLTHMGLVVAKKRGRHEHFFVAGSRAAATSNVIAAMQNETARKIVEAVLRHPGIIQKDLCELLGIAPSTASGHLSRLREAGAILEQQEWKKRRYYAGDALANVPLTLGGTAHGDAPAPSAPSAATAVA